ncbi:hypothetical protein TWF718_008476 [Orbilia javanica]|uniref:F-box domain-containing protein n=1 Tax=Orbilia javanica TaxID=47235 RepID=A0AAN8NUB1_9PEZI
MKILSLPTEILIQIIEYLTWLDHFALSTVSPVFTAVLQHKSFRRQRYCEEIWDDGKKTQVFNIKFRRFLPDELRYWPDGPGWRSELGIHGLLASGKLILKLEKNGKRTNILATRLADTTKGPDSRLIDPMMRALRAKWGEMATVNISLDLLAEDGHYFKGKELDDEASFEKNRPGKDDDLGDGSLRADYSHIGTLGFGQSGDQGDSVERALRSGKISVYDMIGQYPQIFRIRYPIYLVDGEFADSLERGVDKYRTIHITWDGPGSSVKDVIDMVATGFTREILDRSEEIMGCWVRFSQFNFFPLPDYIDRVHPRWKIFLDVLLVKEVSN